MLSRYLRVAARRGAGRLFCFAQDARFAGGSLGAQHADTIVRVQRLALDARVPVIGFVESGGARMQEGLGALNGYARIFSEHVAVAGEIPQISVITGTSAGGGCYSPALTDFMIMTERGEHVPHRSRGRARGHRRGRDRPRARRAGRASAATA